MEHFVLTLEIFQISFIIIFRLPSQMKLQLPRSQTILFRTRRSKKRLWQNDRVGTWTFILYFCPTAFSGKERNDGKDRYTLLRQPCFMTVFFGHAARHKNKRNKFLRLVVHAGLCIFSRVICQKYIIICAGNPICPFRKRTKNQTYLHTTYTHKKGKLCWFSLRQSLVIYEHRVISKLRTCVTSLLSWKRYETRKATCTTRLFAGKTCRNANISLLYNFPRSLSSILSLYPPYLLSFFSHTLPRLPTYFSAASSDLTIAQTSFFFHFIVYRKNLRGPVFSKSLTISLVWSLF